MKTLPIMLSVLLLTGCASQVPINISQAPTPDVLLATATAAVDGYKNQPVRWGGSILAVHNKPAETEIEVLALPLGSSGRPIDGDGVQGRFLARLSGFQDPAVFAQGRHLTVYGLLEGGENRAIGEKPYVYPIVAVQSHTLWPREPAYAAGKAAYCGYSYYRSGFYPGRFGYGFRGGYYGRYW